VKQRFAIAATVSAAVSFTGCQQRLDSLHVVLERHSRAVAKLPAEEQAQLLPYGSPVTRKQVESLLPADVLTLEAARSLAIRANPDVHAAQARLQAAAARVAQARSRYYPSLTFSHNSTRTFHTPASRNRLATALQPAPVVPAEIDDPNFALTTLINALRRPLFGRDAEGNSNSFSEHATAFSSAWTMFDGFVREAQLLSAKYLHEATEQALIDVQRLIVQSVDTAYYQVQLAQEHLRIARAAEEFSTEQWEETRKLSAAGRATQADVDNFRVRVLAAQAETSQAEGRRETGRVVLAELMGLGDVELPSALSLSALIEEDPSLMSSPSTGEWLEKSLANRPDVAQLEQVLKSDEENVRAANGLYSPVWLLSGSWGFDRTSNLRYEVDDQSSAAGLEVRWELFNGGRREAQIREAESRRAETAALLNRTRLSVQAQVRSSIIDVMNSQQRIHLYRENVVTARENRRIIQAGYLAGRETLNRLNEAQRDYISADADLALARIELRQAWSDLQAAAATNQPNTNGKYDERQPPDR